MGLVTGPDRDDPYGEAPVRLGAEIVSKVMDEMTLADCISLALKKCPNDTRESALITTKLEEAELWAMKDQRMKGRKA